jgi:hypothetical protein
MRPKSKRIIMVIGVARPHAILAIAWGVEDDFFVNCSYSSLCLTLLPPSRITLHSVFGQSQTFQILTKHINKTINNYETKYMQYENIFYDNSNNGYFIL